MFCVPIPCFGCSRAIGILLLAFWIWTLVDCYKNEPAGSNDKILWLVLIVLAPVFGAAFYVLIRRPVRKQRYGR